MPEQLTTRIFEVDSQRQHWRDITPAQSNPLIEALQDEGMTLEEATKRYRLLKRQDPIGDTIRKLKQTAFAESARSANLLEAFVAQPDAANMLRDGVRFLSLLAYAEQPSTFDAFTTRMPSDRPQEEWLRDASLGTIPRTRSGEPAPMLLSGFEGGALIKNFNYSGLVEVTGDDIRYDRLGKIRQIAPEMGIAARMTEEQTVYADITNTANFVRSSTTGDNDVGANTQTLAFSALGLEAALAIIQTSKDRKSGRYLGMRANTLICGPRLQWYVKQLLMSPSIVRASANNTAEVRGLGTTNPYVGEIERVIVTPWFGASYQWALCDSSRQSYFYQSVEPFNVLAEAQGPTSEAWLTRDSLRYKVAGIFGTGFVDDRAWFYSDTTSQPAVS